MRNKLVFGLFLMIALLFVLQLTYIAYRYSSSARNRGDVSIDPAQVASMAITQEMLPPLVVVPEKSQPKKPSSSPTIKPVKPEKKKEKICVAKSVQKILSQIKSRVEEEKLRKEVHLENSFGTCKHNWQEVWLESSLICEATSFDPVRYSTIVCKAHGSLQTSNCLLGGFILDRNRVQCSTGGEPIESVANRVEGDEFPRYQKGAWSGSCSMVAPNSLNDVRSRLPHHLWDLVSSVRSIPSQNKTDKCLCDKWVEMPVMFVTRYEYANLYHTMTDYFNLYHALQMFNIRMDRPFIIVFLDGHAWGALDASWELMFPFAKVMRLSELPEKFCMAQAVWVSPGYRSPLSLSLQGPDPCSNIPVVAKFRTHVIRALGLESLWLSPSLSPPPKNSDDRLKKPRATFVVRAAYVAHPRNMLGTATRVGPEGMAETLADLSHRRPDVEWKSVVLSDMPFVEQVREFIQADVIFGVHGAGMSHALWMRPNATLVEWAVGGYEGRYHFHNFALWAGIKYLRLAQGQGLTAAGAERWRLQTASLLEVLPTSLAHKVSRTTSAFALAGADAANTLPTPSSAHSPAPLSSQKTVNHSLCVIVPFRESSAQTSQGQGRSDNLQQFFRYMHPFLQRQHLDYTIVVAEQSSLGIFNKGRMFNVGVKVSESVGCDYLVLHDVDQLPEKDENRYAWPENEIPVHLCSASSQFGYRTAYGNMVGGALLMTRRNYEQINGFSNFYWGWGQEDDDMYYRISHVFQSLDRLDPVKGRYSALPHPRVKDLDVTPVFREGRAHLEATINGNLDIQSDGYANIQFATLREITRTSHVLHFVAELTDVKETLG
jgi:glycoprotein 2-beta-D-xylosyltransferase